MVDLAVPSTGACQCPSGSNGPSCSVLVAQFNGSAHITHTAPLFVRSLSTLITLRFKTVATYGYLLGTNGPTDFIVVSVQASQLVVVFNLGGGIVRVASYVNVSDGLWHTAVFNRTDNLALLFVDDSFQSSVRGPNNRIGLNAIRGIRLGVSPKVGSVFQPFRGLLSDVVFDGADLLSLAFTGNISLS